MSAAAIETLSVVVFKTVVGRTPPFHKAPVPLMNLAPVTISVKLGPPGAAVEGIKLVKTGAAPNSYAPASHGATRGAPR